MKQNSIWTGTAELPRFAPLSGNLRTDVLIVGGGMAGVLCAHALQQEGVDYALVEADRIGGGITENTTAKITAQHGLLYRKLIRRFGVEKARLYLKANLEAVARYRKLCREIDCDFEEKDAFVYSLDDREKIEEEVRALKQLGVPAAFEAELPLPFPVAGAVRFPGQAQFHPLKFLGAVAKDLRIFERTKVRHLAPGKAITEHGTVSAKKIVVATHFPILNKHGAYFLKLYQERSYVLALENAPEVGGMYLDEQTGGLSFRNFDRFLLLGGGSHRTGKPGGWQGLEDFARRYYPNAKIAARWATQDCMSLDDVPYIGQYAKSTPDLYVASGFNKWGMTSAMAAASVLADLLSGRESPYAAVFSPARSMLRPQLFCNAAEAVWNLLTPTVPRCPHLGCALKYNPAEHSWDCPCHGSRFAVDGTLLDNPATDDKQHLKMQR